MRVPSRCLSVSSCVRKIIKRAKLVLKAKKSELTNSNKRCDVSKELEAERKKLQQISEEVERWKSKEKSSVTKLGKCVAEKKECSRLKDDIVNTLQTVETQNALRVFNLTGTLDQNRELTSQVSRLKEQNNRLKVKITQVRMGLGLNDDINEYLQANITQCYKQIQNLTRQNKDNQAKVHQLDVCLKEKNQLVKMLSAKSSQPPSTARRTESTIIKDNNNSIQKHNIHADDSALLRKMQMKDLLIMKMREDLESCLVILKARREDSNASDQGENEEEECVSPCTITKSRSSGSFGSDSWLRKSQLVRDLTIENQQLKKELAGKDFKQSTKLETQRSQESATASAASRFINVLKTVAARKPVNSTPGRGNIIKFNHKNNKFSIISAN